MSNEINVSDAFTSKLHYEEEPFNKYYRFIIFQDGKPQAATWCEDQADAICLSVNNHDRLVEENKRLREFAGNAAFVCNTFARDINAGFITKDKEFAVSLLCGAVELLSELDGKK